MNVLFIMADQLRWDHLGCTGHPCLKTPNLDALARRGVRFVNAFVNSGVCGPSRMSFYTGRYAISHGATWNRAPLTVGKVTLGKHVHQCRAFSLRDERWHYVYWLDEPEQLFDLAADPDELHDLGRDAWTAAVRSAMRDRLLDFLARRMHRSTVTDEAVQRGTGAYKKAGVFFGPW